MRALSATEAGYGCEVRPFGAEVVISDVLVASYVVMQENGAARRRSESGELRDKASCEGEDTEEKVKVKVEEGVECLECVTWELLSAACLDLLLLEINTCHRPIVNFSPLCRYLSRAPRAQAANGYERVIIATSSE